MKTGTRSQQLSTPGEAGTSKAICVSGASASQGCVPESTMLPQHRRVFFFTFNESQLVSLKVSELLQSELLKRLQGACCATAVPGDRSYICPFPKQGAKPVGLRPVQRSLRAVIGNLEVARSHPWEFKSFMPVLWRANAHRPDPGEGLPRAWRVTTVQLGWHPQAPCPVALGEPHGLTRHHPRWTAKP